MTIPSGFFDCYYTEMDCLIEDQTIGNLATLYYKSNSSRDYSIFEEDTYNPSDVVKTDNIRLKVYYSSKNWIKIGNTEFIDGRIQVVGYFSDIPNINKADYIQINNQKYKLATSPVSHGFGNRYFIAFFDLV